MPKHPFNKDRDCSKSEGLLLQIGDIDAGKKFCDVEFSRSRIALSAAIVRVDVNIQIEVPRLDPAIDQRLSTIVQRAGHAQLQGHCAPACVSGITAMAPSASPSIHP